MSTKAAYNHDDKTKKRSFTLQASLIERAKARAETETDGNLSRYVQGLIEADSASGEGAVLDRFLRMASQGRDEVLSAFTWATAEQVQAIEAEIKELQQEVEALVAQKSKVSTEEEFEKIFAALAETLRRRAFAQRKLRVSRPPSLALVMNTIAKELAEYSQLAMSLAEKDVSACRKTWGRDPQFALRNPLHLKTPEEVEFENRLLPVVIPKGLYDDMRKRLQELDGHAQSSS